MTNATTSETFRKKVFLAAGNIRMYPRSVFWYRGTPAKTTLLETTLCEPPRNPQDRNLVNQVSANPWGERYRTGLNTKIEKIMGLITRNNVHLHKGFGNLSGSFRPTDKNCWNERSTDKQGALSANSPATLSKNSSVYLAKSG